MSGKRSEKSTRKYFVYSRFNKSLFSIIIVGATLLLISATIVIFSGFESGYTPLTNKCISCHNDTGYLNDTDMDGVFAPYKRPHNNTIMCEICHGPDPH